MSRKQMAHSMKILENVLKKHPPDCPICMNKLRFGYLGGYGDFFWSNKKGKYVIRIDKKLNKQLSWLPKLPSYLCESCHMTITQYKKISKYSIADISEKKNSFVSCPYCNHMLMKGYIFFGVAGGSCIPYISWSEMYGFRYWKGKRIYLTKHPFVGLFVEKTPAQRCKNCGIIYSEYSFKKIEN